MQEKKWKLLNKRDREDVTESRTLMRFRSMINKLGEKNFEKLSLQILEFKIEDDDTLTGMANLLFDKMVYESVFREIYLKLLRLIKDRDIIINNRRKSIKMAFVYKCQKEFTDSLTISPNPLNDPEKEAKLKTYVCGTCQMLGLLFKEGFLTPMLLKKHCLDKMLESTKQDGRRYALENFCLLLQNLLNSSNDLLDIPTKQHYIQELTNLLPIAKEYHGYRLYFLIEKVCKLLSTNC